MPDRPDELEATVDQGVARVDPFSPPAASRPRRGPVGCLLLPLLLATILLAGGIFRLLHWSDLDAVGQLAAIVLTVTGAAALLIVVAMFLVLRAFARAMGQMRRDAVQVVEAMKYMANRPNHYGSDSRLPDALPEDDPPPPAAS